MENNDQIEELDEEAIQEAGVVLRKKLSLRIKNLMMKEEVDFNSLKEE